MRKRNKNWTSVNLNVVASSPSDPMGDWASFSYLFYLCKYNSQNHIM